MELLILILVIILLLVGFSNYRRSHQQSIDILHRKVEELLTETRELRKDVKSLSKAAPPPSVAPAAGAVPQPKAAPVAPPAVPPAKQSVRTFEPAPAAKPPANRVPRESWMQTWLRNNPDIEKFIGENLVNKIGIAVLVLGIAFFVKYAIDKNWINEVGRVSIGLFCGGVLVGLAHYLRNNYRSFSSVLAGGGIAVFYFTIAFAFHQYALLSQTAAFLIMVVITGFAILLSLLYNRIELAVIAAVGGFLTPLIVSTGQGNYLVLLTYLAILNSGLLALSYFKRWPLINIIALVFTQLLFGGWLAATLVRDTPGVSYTVALLFASLYYLQFLAMNMVYQVRTRAAFAALDYSVLLLLNGSFFAAGMLLLQQVDGGQWQGLFTLGVGLINLALAWYFFRREEKDKNLLYLLIGLTLTFLSLTIPVQLEGHAVTMFWSAEFVLLLWLYQRSRIHIFFYSSLLVTAITVISLLMDWAAVVTTDKSNLVLIYNDLRGLVTNIVATIAFTCYAMLLNREAEPLPVRLPGLRLKQAYWLAAFVLAYLTAVYGVNLGFSQHEGYSVPNVYHRLVTQVAAMLLGLWLHRKVAIENRWPLLGAVSLYLLYHLFSLPLITELRNGVSQQRFSGVHLVFHWGSVLTAIALVYFSVQTLRHSKIPHLPVNRTAWMLSVLMVIFFSQEMKHLYVILTQSSGSILFAEEQYEKAVLTIVWALCSFGLMWIGMQHKYKTARIISLSLFSLALLKLFLFDIAEVSEGGKIAAFILLGVLLLTISFMYQKLKKIIIDDVPE